MRYEGRTPHGVRGLKLDGHGVQCQDGGRTPHGVRGLKFGSARMDIANYGRTPHGVRGLKFGDQLGHRPESTVAPLTGCVD